MARTGNTFWPDDTHDTLHLTEANLETVLERAAEAWPGILPREIAISSEHIQTKCLGYDLYDPSDYTDFILIKADASYFERVATTGTAASSSDDEPLIHGHFSCCPIM